MRLGMVGLGRMGGNMARRLMRAGHEVVAYDVAPDAVEALASEGAVPAPDLKGLVAQLDGQRVVWLMLPAGEITQSAVDELMASLRPGDVVIDGGNSRHTDSVQRAATLFTRGISFVDVGTSGGVWGLEEGYCLMVGADEEEFTRLEPLFEALAPDGGYARVGPPGSGHYVKMVHNAIEYALMQSYAEGFELMERSGNDLDLAQVANVWRHGSVIRSWLLDLAAKALDEDPELAGLGERVSDSGEGRWTLQEAVEAGVPMPALTAALFARFDTQRDSSYGARLMAALRREFGGHAVEKADG